MRVTVDINVLLDVFQNRIPHYAESAQVLNLIVAGKLEAVCPAHGLTTLYYLVRRYASKTAAESAMDRVLAHFQIGNLDAAGWQQARRLNLSDFEDSVVATVAHTSGSAYIVTRNTSDFAGTEVPALSPMDFLGQFKE